MKLRRESFLIDRKFQVRFAIYVCSWLIALSFIYPFIVNSLFDFCVRSIVVDPNSAAVKALRHTQTQIFWLLAVLQLVFLVITFINSVFMSHRICGPLQKLMRNFDKVKGGDLKGQLSFRSKDHFQQLAESFNQMIDGLRTKVKRSQDQFDEVEQELRALQAAADPEMSARLQRAQSLLKDAREQLPQ